jgi:hypothetical protein
MPGTNTLAYYRNSQITAVKKFYNIVTRLSRSSCALPTTTPTSKSTFVQTIEGGVDALNPCILLQTRNQKGFQKSNLGINKKKRKKIAKQL